MWSHLSAYNTMLTLRWESATKDSHCIKEKRSWIITRSVPICILGFLQYPHIDSNLKFGFAIYKNLGPLSLVLNRNLAPKPENIFERAAISRLPWNDNSVPLDDGCQYQKPERTVEMPSDLVWKLVTLSSWFSVRLKDDRPIWRKTV